MSEVRSFIDGSKLAEFREHLRTFGSCCALLRGSIGAVRAAASLFSAYLRDNFDYAGFTSFEAPAPPKTLIYQSNGFMALQEFGFGRQVDFFPSPERLLPLTTATASPR